MPQTPEQRAANLAKGRATAATNRAAKKAAPVKPVAPAPDPDSTPGEDTPLFDVEEAPPGILDNESALSKVFKKLGLKGPAEKKEEAYKAPQAKLSKAQQSLYDSFAPLAIQAFIVCAGWTWSLVGEDYKFLAPSEEVAEKIVAPLMRIWARTSKMGASLNPNHTDAAASLAALIGYVWTSIQMYQHIKIEKEQYGSSTIVGSNGAGATHAYEGGYGSSDTRRDAVGAASGVNGADTQSNGSKQPGVDLSHLSESERRAYDKLSQLSQLDYQSRLRRSGRAG